MYGRHQWHHQFRANVCRWTAPRESILDLLSRARSHLSAKDIYAALQPSFPGLGLATVYRTLELMKELGLVVETDFGEGRLRYHHAEKGHHHHLVCRHCGKMTQVDESLFLPLAKSLAKEYGFAADLDHFAIYGTCSKCQEQKKPASAR